MIKVISPKLMLSGLLVAGALFSHESFAQKGTGDKKTTIRIKASEDKDGKVKNIERKYEVGDMTDKERKEFIDKAIDSLDLDEDNRSLDITVDGDGEPMTIRKRKEVIVDRRGDHDGPAFSWNDDFHFDTDKWREHARNFEREFRPQARIMMRDMEDFGDRMGDFWSKEIDRKPASVRELNVYANNPDDGVLNLRFQAPQKGDINVSITDTKGKEVGRKEIKDFSGNFVGQIELKKNTKGTLFVTVVQNEDGATRRVVVP